MTARVLDRGFTHVGGGDHIPTVLVGFALNDWDARDAFAASVAAPPLAAQAAGISDERVAQLIAHRACCGVEDDPANGKLHGYCVVCGVPWPCAYAGTPPAVLAAQAADEREASMQQALAALEEMRPATAYGIVGSRDVDQARWRKAVDDAIVILRASPPPPPRDADTDKPGEK